MEYRAKVAILGACGCGKSSLAKKFLTGGFDPSHPTTIGAAFSTKEVDRNGQAIHLDIWDTAGQERYSAIAPMYYRDAHTVVVVYDVLDQESVQAARKWCKEVHMRNKNALIIVFGNKIDLVLKSQITSGFYVGEKEGVHASVLRACHENASAHFSEYNVVHLYGSAKTGEGVTHLFKVIGARTQYSKKITVMPSSWWCF
ncbi:Ras-related protein Rab-5C [Nematocida sp. AWRm77]|nr:Ras-related protein Rab-5C [Nematocida sp. AWRm77]